MNYYIKKKKRKSLIGRIKFSVVAWLIIINIIASIIGFFLFALSEDYINYIALKPENILQGKFLWTLITHMFVHGGIGHLLINMFVLFSLGGLCEKIIGRKRFLWFYILSGLFAGILSVLLAGFFGLTDLGQRIFGSPDIFMVGASGAIFAIAGLYVVLLPRLKFMIIFLPFFSLPAYVMVPLVLFIMWGVSILFNWPIGNVAHFGGFLAGIIYGSYLRTRYRKKVQRLQGRFR
ncbi:MAG: rhomboid family intramembrane serine protease [Nanoarchaeota archaeon]|nr:rhomboid family intramembrane serine protease [Nanoarchaeota archaeon]MBU1051843.1 rhomboid family intramembrane serine protease [Nanoarchaeota archaeon]MBU1988212.1 rhomboid family intramembrane serine protease [Nanoarchaeota archaeon]